MPSEFCTKENKNESWKFYFAVNKRSISTLSNLIIALKKRMEIFDLVKATIKIVRDTYKLAVIIRDSEKISNTTKQTITYITTDLNIVASLLDYLHKFSYRVTIQDEQLLIINIASLKSIVDETYNILEDAQRNRSFFHRLFMKKDDFKQQLQHIRRHLNNLCVRIQGELPSIAKVLIIRQEFPDFRKTFHNVPEKTLSFYDFSIIKNTPHSISTITLEEFDTKTKLFYLNVSNEQLFLSYQLRTWSALNPKFIVLEQRKREFTKNWQKKSNSAVSASTSTQLQSTTSPLATTNNIHQTLDFSEFFMSHDDICGMTLTQSLIYIATKYEITIASLTTQSIIAQYGTEGDKPNTFKDISYIYISSNEETNLYIVDRGQAAVHQYNIDDTGNSFEYICRYVVIADVPQQCNLISCAIYNKNLYVSDDANNCLHIFALNGDRQSSYLCDDITTPFTPGSICAHGDYLYVTNCSPENPGILVLNEDCQPVDWFRNPIIKEILAIDIDPYINELYILTTEETGNDLQKTRPLIVSMNLLIRSQQS